MPRHYVVKYELEVEEDIDTEKYEYIEDAIKNARAYIEDKLKAEAKSLAHDAEIKVYDAALNLVAYIAAKENKDV